MSAGDFVPAGAFFRRAVGLELRASVCAGAAEVEYAARREEEPTLGVLSRAEAELVCRLDGWQSAQEAGASLETLRELVARDLLYFSRARPRQALSAGLHGELAGPVALRRNVLAQPLVEIDGQVQPLPFMPRRGDLAGVRLWGMDFTVHEMNEQTHGVSLACCERHGRALRELLPRLTGEHDAAALRARPEFAELLPVLHAFGLLERHCPAPRPPRAAPSVTWYGHAAVLFEDAGTRVFVDPLFHPCSVPARRGEDTPPDPRDVGPLDAVLITHADNDHLNPRSLAWFAPETPVYLPAPARPEPYQVDAEGLLALLGFSDVRPVAEWERTRVGALTLVAAPFRGEDWGLSLAARTYVLSGPGATVYLNADCEFMPDVYREVARDFRVDLALVGVAGCEESYAMPPGYGYGGLYTPWVPAEKRNEWVRLSSTPVEAAEAAVLLGARRAFGYAAGGVSFMTMAFSDRGTHEEMAEALAARGDGARAVALPLGRPFALG